MWTRRSRTKIYKLVSLWSVCCDVRAMLMRCSCKWRKEDILFFVDVMLHHGGEGEGSSRHVVGERCWRARIFPVLLAWSDLLLEDGESIEEDFSIAFVGGYVLSAAQVVVRFQFSHSSAVFGQVRFCMFWMFLFWIFFPVFQEEVFRTWLAIGSSQNDMCSGTPSRTEFWKYDEVRYFVDQNVSSRGKSQQVRSCIR